MLPVAFKISNTTKIVSALWLYLLDIFAAICSLLAVQAQIDLKSIKSEDLHKAASEAWHDNALEADI